MKLNKTLLTLFLFTISLNLFSKNSIQEISIGFLQLKYAYYVPVSNKTIVGANSSGGLYGSNFTPLIEIAPTAKHFFTPQKNGTLFLSTEIYLQHIFQRARQERPGTTSFGLGAGVGYKIYFGENKRLYFSPSLNFRLPLYRQGGNNYTIKDIGRISLYKTTMNSITFGYVF